MALTEKIQCFGIKPKKSEIYKLAAELVELEQITAFYEAVIEAFKSNDYYGYYDNYGYDYYSYYDYDYSIKEKVIALLFLSAMYESTGE